MSLELIKSMLDRAETLSCNLRKESVACLEQQRVSNDALNLTHEVVEKCANALDQLMTLAWSQRLRPKLANAPARGGYFPAAKDEAAFRSAMGQWGAANIDEIDPEFAAVLRSFQPFVSTGNSWLSSLRDLAAKKHTGLVPQRRIEERTVEVKSDTGSVKWGRGVSFSGNVSVMGARIDPRTQLPEPKAGLKTDIVRWVTFQIEGTNLNALGFCDQVVRQTRQVVQRFESELGVA